VAENAAAQVAFSAEEIEQLLASGLNMSELK